MQVHPSLQHSNRQPEQADYQRNNLHLKQDGLQGIEDKHYRGQDQRCDSKGQLQELA